MTNVTPATEQSIAARLERLPISSWHIKMRMILGVGTFFDGFDSLALAYVLPVLIGAWKIAPQQIGALLAIGFAGQAIGALFFGWLAERFGRIPATRMTIALFAIMSLVCATAHTYDQLFWYRFIQGIGLGGEVPIAAAYVSEIARSDSRGRFVMLYNVIFPVGLLVVGFVGAWVVPRFGWQWMFILGAAPALVAVVLQKLCLESPRWLASKGRLKEADSVLTRIENLVSMNGARPLPPVKAVVAQLPRKKTRWAELLEGCYRTRTLIVWVLWSSSYLVSFGLVVWMPTLYRSVYHLPLQTSLNYSLFTNAAGLLGSLTCALAIDKIGRRRLFVIAFFLTSVMLFALWITGADVLVTVVALTSIAYFGIYMTNNALYLYTSEIYPTRMRALGGSSATFWLRLASIAGPYVVGLMLPLYGIAGVFFFFAAIAAMGGVASLLGAIETRGKVLEEISP